MFIIDYILDFGYSVFDFLKSWGIPVYSIPEDLQPAIIFLMLGFATLLAILIIVIIPIAIFFGGGALLFSYRYLKAFRYANTIKIVESNIVHLLKHGDIEADKHNRIQEICEEAWRGDIKHHAFKQRMKHEKVLRGFW